MEDTVTNENNINKDKGNNRPKTAKILFQNKNNNQYVEKNNTEKNKILESINGNSNPLKNVINKELDIIEELSLIEPLNNKINNLKNINLLEKDINNLYKWEHLFNNFRPISCYTTLKSEKENETKEENKNEEFKSPILLVDLPEEQMNLFFGRNNNFELSRNKNNQNNDNNGKSFRNGRGNSYNASHINNNINHNIRPMSMYSPRINNSCYYYSSAFSDYYKEDFKSFCNKMPILKAKLKIYPEKLKNEIFKHDKTSIKKEKILNKLRSSESIDLQKQDLIIAAQRKNPIPLLKSIFKQTYPGIEVIKESPKLYLNTMKPYGNDSGNVDYFKNDRWKLSNEIIKMRNKNANIPNRLTKNNSNNANKKNKKLFLSYYDINDPYIILFNKKINKIKNDGKIKYNEEIYIIKDNNTNQVNPPANNNQINNTNNNLEIKDFESNKTISDELQIKSKNENNEKKENIPNINISYPNNKNIKNLKNKNLKKLSNTLNNLGTKDDTLYTDYLSPNCFPLKTSSDVGNTSYNKINKMIRDKKLLNKIKLDYSLTQSKTAKKNYTKGNEISKSNINNTNTNINKKYDIKKDIDLIINSKKIKPKKNFSLYETATTDERNNYNNLGIKKYQHWDKEGNLINSNSPRVNYLCFNNYINTIFNKDLIKFKKNEEKQYFYPMNTYNKLAGKYYRYNDESKKKDKDKDKNNNSKDIIHNLFDYSRDEPENEIQTTRKTEIKKEKDEVNNQLNNSSNKKIFLYED